MLRITDNYTLQMMSVPSPFLTTSIRPPTACCIAVSSCGTLASYGAFCGSTI